MLKLTHRLTGRIGLALATALFAFSGSAAADTCSFSPAEAHKVASEAGLKFSCVIYYEASKTTAPSDFKVFEDGSIGCEGMTPNELGIAWIYMNLFTREAGPGLGKGWDVWNYDVTGLPHTRIGAGAPIRVITTTLGPNAKYQLRVTKIDLINPFRKCPNALQEAMQ